MRPTFLLIPLIAILAGCSLSPGSIPSTLPAPAIATSKPSETPVTATCPAETDGMVLLRNDPMGYCFLHPDHLFRIDPFETEICLVPELPAMACHSNFLQLEVTDTNGLTVGELADQITPQVEIEITRTNTMIAGEEAIILADVPAQDWLREVLIVHQDHLYRLRFVVPDPEDNAAVERFNLLFSTVIDSFTLLPPL